MARHVVTKNGDDPLTAPIVEYLAREYGMDPADMRRVELISEVGDLQLLVVTLMVRTKRVVYPPPHRTCVETTAHAELARGARSYICTDECPAPARCQATAEIAGGPDRAACVRDVGHPGWHDFRSGATAWIPAARQSDAP
jgi:hypothetical protein